MVKNVNKNARKTTGLSLLQDDGSMREIYEDDLDEKSRPIANNLAKLLGRKDRKENSYTQALDIVAEYEDLIVVLKDIRKTLNNLLPAQANIRVASGFSKPITDQEE